ncbi:hypothetical protein COI68_26120 [Priestia megaterium]|uniref:helix-turn-helix domain-containing protein n=1 Tax=Priestia megaterium TaxID=1404 RepID=UPI000BF64DD3|nr:hypothetical protein COI68_26120 [Priestia megaterium]
MKGVISNRYLTEIRLKNAATSLIKDPNWTIEYIAQKAGFSCANYISKFFKKHVGVLPYCCNRFRKYTCH